MVAKGAWLNRPAIIRQARQTNRYDVQVERLRQLGAALRELHANGQIIGRAELILAIKEVS